MTIEIDRLFARLRARVASRMAGTKLRKTRAGGWYRVNFGEYCLWDIRRNCAVETHVDLVELESRFGVEMTNGGLEHAS